MLPEDCQNILRKTWEIDYLKKCLGIASHFPDVIMVVQKFSLAFIGYNTPVNCEHCYVSGDC